MTEHLFQGLFGQYEANTPDALNARRIYPMRSDRGDILLPVPIVIYLILIIQARFRRMAWLFLSRFVNHNVVLFVCF